MQYEKLRSLARAKRWEDLETEWLKVVERPGSAPDQLLPVIDLVVEAGQGKLAETIGWAWLSSMKQNHTAREALTLGRGLLLRLPDGEQLREEILELYNETHRENPELESWVDKSGLKAGKSVRRALRYLDVGLRLVDGCYLINRSDDEAAQVENLDFDEEEVILNIGRRTRTLSINEVINDFDIADKDDFHVLQQLNPERIAELVQNDPIRLVTGILRCNRNRIDRDELKLMLVPAHLESKRWTDWWSKIRNGVKKSTNLQIEGRSPMFLVYDPIGQTLEQETSAAFQQAESPRQWLDILEGYLRDTKLRKVEPDSGFLNQIQEALVGQIQRFINHREHRNAFATALVIERLAADGLPISTDAHGTALEMLTTSDDPITLAGSVPDTRLWPLAMNCVEQAFPDKWPESFAELILYAPAGQCNSLAKRVEKEGKGVLLQLAVDRAVATPGEFTDALMWIWKGIDLKTELKLPPSRELFNIVLALVGPARMSEGKAVGQSVNQMRAKVRAGLSSKNCQRFRESIKEMDLPLAQTVRRQIERAEGLGPSGQGELLNILAQVFPALYVKEAVPLWADESVLYFTREGLRIRESELDELVNVKMRENAKAIGAAAAHGDLSENSEYKFALEERDLLRARVAQINTELSIAKIIEAGDIANDHVSIGQRIELRPITGGDATAMTILGVGDSDIAQRIFAYKTSLAQQVMGKKLGERAQLSFDGEEEVEYEVSSIVKVL